VPALFQSVRSTGDDRPWRDALAGVALAAMNVPQVLGYTRIAGTPVVTGLYTLLLPLVTFAAFGSSRYLVVAADSATAAILAGTLPGLAPVGSEHYVALAGCVALLTAVCLLVARILRLGFLADFLSQTVLVGFLTGVGVQVGIAVLGEMLGLSIAAHRTLAQLAAVVRELPALHVPTLALSATVVAVILGVRQVAPRAPGPLVAVAGAMVASVALDLPARGIAVVGPVPGGLPQIGLPAVTWAEARALVPVALSCFFMIVAQSAATARVYAARHRERLDEDADLVGLAAANAAAAFSGTFVVNGSPTQTAMVERSGGRTQLAHLTVAAVVVAVLLLLSSALQHLPRCVLRAIVFTIAVGLVDVRALRDILAESPGEFRLALVTAGVVVAIGVEQGILLAMGLSLLRHVRHSYRPHTAVLVADNGVWRGVPAAPGTTSGPGLVIFRFGADLFYANVARFVDDVHGLIEGAPAPVAWLVVDAGAITSVDYSAARALRELHADLTRLGVTLALVHAAASLLDDLDRHRLREVFGAGCVFEKLHDALAAIGSRPPSAP